MVTTIHHRTRKLRIYTSILCFSCQYQYTTNAFAYHATSTPPLLDVPVYSLSTLGKPSASDSQGRSGTMNILTYASPVSSAPNRMWCMSLYKGTLSHENFARERRGILQLLRPDHVHCSNIGNSAIGSEAVGDLIRVLGGASGRDVDKRESCAKLGFVWDKLSQIGEVNEEEDDSWPLVLPSCLYYLKLELVGDLIDCGSHEAALCRVVAMLSGDDANDLELDLLSTRQLRRESIISELGRVI